MSIWSLIEDIANEAKSKEETQYYFHCSLVGFIQRMIRDNCLSENELKDLKTTCEIFAKKEDKHAIEILKLLNK